MKNFKFSTSAEVEILVIYIILDARLVLITMKCLSFIMQACSFSSYENEQVSFLQSKLLLAKGVQKKFKVASLTRKWFALRSYGADMHLKYMRTW